MDALLAIERKKYHKKLIQQGLLCICGDKGIPSNADKDNAISVYAAKEIAKKLQVPNGDKLSSQKAGSTFEQINKDFLEATFPELKHLRPGDWGIIKIGNNQSKETSHFVQYEHLNKLNDLANDNPELAASVGNNYTVTPDIVIYQELLKDSEINAGEKIIVDNSTAQRSSIRKREGNIRILHASVSAKWTIRSDRAQNSRTEALGLIRNRKGRLPHIVVVTGEPLPSRIASLALGTGDIDCVYHFALNELETAIENLNKPTGPKQFDKKTIEKEYKTFRSLLDGKRLKDISDLPLDLLL